MNRIGWNSLKRMTLTMAALAMTAPRLHGCAVCFGESDAPMARGLTWAILLLAGVIAAVLSGVVVFFVHMGRRQSGGAGAEKAPTET